MEINWLVESIGLAGSLLVALSMTMKGIKNLRIINLLGCLFFGCYGIIIHSFSVTLLNLFTSGVNIFFLVRLYMDQLRPDSFDILFKNPATDDYLQRFIMYHSKDIKRFFPSFDPDVQTGTLGGTECCLILRETLPVSLVAFRKGEGREIEVVLDYAVPAYRDFKNGKFFFDTIISQIAQPGTVFAAVGGVPAHSAYLRKLGFKQVFVDAQGTHFRKELKS